MTEALIKTESGGNCNAVGKSGETGCTQHMPASWRNHSTIVLGYVAKQTPINEKYVVAHIIQRWMDQGLTDYQIGLKYNGGEVKEKKGVNQFGAAYDTAAYARKLLANREN